MSKYCPNCGAYLEDDALFCGECGTRCEQPAQPAEPPKPEHTDYYGEPAQQTAPEYQNPYLQSEQTRYTQYREPQQPTPPPQDYYQPYGQNYYPQQPVQYANRPVAQQKKPGKGFGIASMILGIAAVVNSMILLLLDLVTGLINSTSTAEQRVAAFGMSFVINFFAGFICVLALMSLAFGIVSLVKCKRGTAITGLILSGISIIICIFSFITVANLDKASLSEVMDYSKKNNNNTYSFDFDDEDIQDYENFFNDFIE